LRLLLRTGILISAHARITLDVCCLSFTPFPHASCRMRSKRSLFLLGAPFVLRIVAAQYVVSTECYVRMPDSHEQPLQQADPSQATCFSNMLQQAAGGGCQIDDRKCVCSGTNFNRGMRDCVAQSCPGGNPAIGPEIKQYVVQWCGMLKACLQPFDR
jgi:CFEM domain